MRQINDFSPRPLFSTKFAEGTILQRQKKAQVVHHKLLFPVIIVKIMNEPDDQDAFFLSAPIIPPSIHQPNLS